MKVFTKKTISFWNILPIFVLILFLAPIIFIFTSLFSNFNDNWNHLYNYVLIEYITNSIYLILGISFLTLIIGTGTAWVVTNYNFYGKNILESILILPLAIPPYILAYTFTGLFDLNGTINIILRNIFIFDSNFILFDNIRNIYGAIIVFSFTLYPYVYIISRTAFLSQSISLIEAGRTLGLSKFQVFHKLSIPLIRPAVIAGLSLVIMEVLSDFGAVEHFSIVTFTTGIFRTWYGMYDLKTAMQLSSILLLFITFFILLEKYSRGNQIYSKPGGSSNTYKIKKISGLKSLFAFSFCIFPVLIGFILPMIQLIFWSINYNLSFFDKKFIQIAFNTIFISLLAGLICSFIALLINFSLRLKKTKLKNYINSFFSIGYALPGLILAIGILKFFSTIDDLFSNFILTGSIFGLLIAYLIKSYALANSSFEYGFTNISSGIDDSAKILKSSGWNLLRRIHFPLLKTSFLTSFLLVFTEVVKELPATLILRPFNFDTLAVSTYIYAAEERMYQAATPAIAIIIVGLIPIIFLSKMIQNSKVSK